MKLYSKLIISAILGFASFAAHAGDYCFTSGRDCDVDSGCDTGCCDNAGYLFAYGGISFLDSLNTKVLNPDFVFNNTGSPVSRTETFDLDTGFIIGGGAGVRSCFLGGTRFEIEGLYTENDYDSVTLNDFGTRFQDLRGDYSTAAVMVNFLKEIPIGCFTGYVGGGFGLAQTESDLEFLGQTVSDTDFSLAHQFIVGADVPVSDCLSLFIQYKLFNGGDVDLLCPTGVAGVTKLAQFEGEYNSNLVFGARFFY